MNFRLTLYFLLSALLCFTTPLLSKEQAQEQSDVLTVVAMENTLPYSITLPDGTPSGLYVEFWKLWSETNNIPIKIVIVPFVEGLELAKEKNIIHSGLFRNEERELWADFTLPIHNVQTGIIYNNTINKNAKLRELKDIKVSVRRASFQDIYLGENYPELNHLVYDEFDDILNKLLFDEIQAVVVELPTVVGRLASKGFTGVFTISDEVILSNDVFGLIAKGQPELLAKINAGIENIPVNKLIELEKKWLPTLKPFFSHNVPLASLTLAEKKWLKQHPSLSLGIELDWYPYEYINDRGDYSGITAEYIDYINNSLSITLEPDKRYSWSESLTAIKNNEIDIISAIGRSPEREKSMLFTDSYISTPSVLVSHKNRFNANSLVSLNGHTLGIVSNTSLMEFITKDYPEIKIIPVDSTLDGLTKLNNGEFDAYISDISIANFTINKEQLSNLIITGFSPYKLELAMAVRSELEPLVGIINKVFLNMSEKEKTAIANNWLSVQVKTGTELSTIALWVLPIISFLVLIILLSLRINRRFKIEIDSRKESEKEQQRLVSQLHQSQKMEALGKLTGGIAHDFNNMLAVILGYSELLKTTSLDEKQLKSYAEHISHAGKRGAKLTDKLLSFTRKQQVEAVEVDINNVLRHQQDVLQKTLTVGIKITLELGENIWPIFLDPNDLEDAILNMSINAKYAMSNNLVPSELMLKTENFVVTKDYSEHLDLVSGNYVKLSVIDNGCGMSKEVSNQIFEPFYSTKGEKGTGLGLSQVFGFVQRSSGSIHVESTVEQGTHFSLYFPKYLNEAENKSIKSPAKTTSLKGSETILIVDDELSLLKLATEFLQREGYHTLVADSGESALIILEKEQVDLVLTDVLMPDMDGYQLASKIKESYPEMKIKLVSGFSDEKNNSFVNDDLQRNLIHKPYNRIELLQGVRTLLDN